MVFFNMNILVKKYLKFHSFKKNKIKNSVNTDAASDMFTYSHATNTEYLGKCLMIFSLYLDIYVFMICTVL